MEKEKTQQTTKETQQVIDKQEELKQFLYTYNMTEEEFKKVSQRCHNIVKKMRP